MFFSEKTYNQSDFFFTLCPMNAIEHTIERHPWPPYVPDGARYLFLGTFPPKPERWSMPFFYPNRINDFWRVMGIIFMNDRDALWDSNVRRFDLAAIKSLLDRERIALWDTAMAVRRLRDNASDKYLEIVEPIDLAALLDAHPSINQVIATGEKAATVVASQAGVDVPVIMSPVDCSIGGHPVRLWRMPSTSRAYPLPLEKKADAYRVIFEQ